MLDYQQNIRLPVSCGFALAHHVHMSFLSTGTSRESIKYLDTKPVQFVLDLHIKMGFCL